MSTTTKFLVEIVTEDKVTDDKHLKEMSENIARAIVNEANNGMGIVADGSDTFTKIVYVKEWYSDHQIIEHVF